MALSAEEKRGLLEDAADSMRREVLSRYRRQHSTISPGDYLRFLQSASELLRPNRPPGRERHRPDPARFLL